MIKRSRAVDYQLFVAGVAPARHIEDPNIYQSWGHSTLIDPLGKVLLKAE
jgi:predicted amidohydrolase